MIQWDDYRLVLSIARANGLQGAASAMAVTLSTIFRRLEKLEQGLEVRLFERNKGHYHPTDAGLELVKVAERMEQDALAGDRAVTGRDQQLSGTVRITSTESIATFFLARHVPAFQKTYPGVSVEVLSDNRRLSLADREADIALRPRRPKEDTLVARQIGKLAWGIYACKATCKQLSFVTSMEDLSGQTLIAWEGSPAANETMRWLNSQIDDLKIVTCSTSILTNAALAASGTAIVPLPCTVGKEWPGLYPVLAPLGEALGELWVITHQDLRRNARIRAFSDFLANAAKKDAALLVGRDT